MILVLNAGSSSIKYKFFKNKKPVLSGHVDAIALKNCKQIIKIDKATIEKNIKAKNHDEALKFVFDSLIDYKIVNNLNEIEAIGHRVVHGGENFKEATIINNKVIKKIEELCSIAPLHNPHNLSGILACKKLLPKVKQVAVFDTAFHQTMPEKAYIYAIPEKFYKKHGIRRYGFHGTSHKYVSDKAYKFLKNKNKKIITCHLGNGSSITAINKGKSIDTSMGFTPLEGLPMGTRSGNLDPAIPLYIQNLLKQSEKNNINEILNKKSGLKALCGFSDMRTIYEKYKKKDKKAILAMDILSYKIAFYISGYLSSLNGVDAIVFTAGIGENAFYLREKICNHLNYLDLKLDKKKNKENKEIISSNKSKVKVFVIKTDEEKQIVEEVEKLIK
ncbi:MAG: acetate/propionate family kinase [Candidatus Woesearchaeota archaeon]